MQSLVLRQGYHQGLSAGQRLRKEAQGIVVSREGPGVPTPGLGSGNGQALGRRVREEDVYILGGACTGSESRVF